jgi:hypothetical protein
VGMRLSLAEGLSRGDEKYFIADLPLPRSGCLTVDHHYSVVADTRLRVIVGRQSSTVHPHGRAPIRQTVACQPGRRILAQLEQIQWCTPTYLDVQAISAIPQASPDLPSRWGASNC